MSHIYVLLYVVKWKIKFFCTNSQFELKFIPCPNFLQHNSTHYCHPDPTPSLAIHLLPNSLIALTALAEHARAARVWRRSTAAAADTTHSIRVSYYIISHRTLQNQCPFPHVTLDNTQGS
jgi:hypothetical protein